MGALPRIREMFGNSIASKAEILHSAELTDKQKSRIRESIGVDIRKYTDLIDPDVSVQADLDAKNLGIDLRKEDWQSQTRFDPGRKRFHLDHVVPVSCLRDACIEANDVHKINEILETEARIVWITKAENSCLDKKGFRSNRPDPDEAYRTCGIKIT